MNTIKTNLLLFTLLICIFVQINNGQTNSYTYQGRLTDNAATANGSYDLQFTLFDNNGAQYGAAQLFEDVSVVNGVFTVQLEADETAFQGANHLLEIAVRPGNQTGAFTILTPRQPITSAPYAISASKAETANVATVALNAVNADDAGSLGGTAANQFVQINNTTAFVRNQTNQQTSVNFNIDGTGTANIFRAATQFNIGGNRVLSIGGTNNFFVGVNAGTSNTTGQNNAFFGANAGYSNTGGSDNLFVGQDAGFSNTTGSTNSFVGRDAGYFNTTGTGNSFFGRTAGYENTSGDGNSFVGYGAGVLTRTGNNNSFVGSITGAQNISGTGNSFFGASAGLTNTNGNRNTIIGYFANVGADSLTFAAAFGAGAIVSSNDTIVLGKTVGIYDGESRSADTVIIPGNLNVSGTFTGNINGASLTNLNATNISSGTLSIARGGTGSAAQNFVDLTTAQTVGGNKTFSATLSGNVVNSATQFTIGGNRVLSVAGTDNSFVGVDAGAVNTGGANTFFGKFSGFNNLTGGSNSFFGRTAGLTNTSGSLNTFIGSASGVGNTTGGGNTAIGYNTSFASGNLSFATAIGSGAIVSTSNTIMLGRTIDMVVAPNLFQVNNLGSAGNISLCRNALNQISTCTAGNLADKTIENSPEIKNLQTQNAQMLEQIKAQQIVIDGLKKLVCANNPAAAVCQ